MDFQPQRLVLLEELVVLLGPVALVLVLLEGLPVEALEAELQARRVVGLHVTSFQESRLQTRSAMSLRPTSFQLTFAS